MKTILITGGTDGLGKALAETFSKKYQIIILGHDENKTAAVAHEIGCDFVVADVANFLQVEKAISTIVARYQTIDCLINNAGIWIEGPLENNSLAHIQKVIGVNTLGTIFLTRAVLPLMKQVKNGKIIQVISQAGLYPKAERSVYIASKYAITGFTQSLTSELVGSGVTIHGFYPGPFESSLYEKVGVTKNMSQFMKLPDIVKSVEFIVECPKDIVISELGVRPANY